VSETNPQKLFLLDAMALLYRAHFALIRAPIRNSKGINTSAIFGFASVLVDLIEKRRPTHLAVAFDTAAPTARHTAFPDYKAQREEMPEDIGIAIPLAHRLLEAMRIPSLVLDGYEADDLIGTLARRAEREGIETWMVTPDKDFGQLVSNHIRILKPGRQGGEWEELGPAEVAARWGIERPDQVIDLLALMGDASDNIPGVPGIGEKTAAKLIAQFGSVEGLLVGVDQLPEKQRDRIAPLADQVRLAHRLATILTDAPVALNPSDLALQGPDESALADLFVELEFNALGRRVLGDGFRAGRGFESSGAADGSGDGDLFANAGAHLKTIADVPHDYRSVTDAGGRTELVAALRKAGSFCFDLETDSLDARTASIVGLAFAVQPGAGYFVSVPAGREEALALLEEFRPLFEDPALEKTGHNLKFDLGILRWHGVRVRGPLFDTMLAHAVIDPDTRHGMDFLSERYLGYTPIPIARLIGDKGDAAQMREVPLQELTDYAAEDADVTLQLRARLEPLLAGSGGERVFREIESPLVAVLVEMEFLGIAIDSAALGDISKQLGADIARLDARILELAGTQFNVNSPKQLGQILFDILKLDAKPKRTKTGQYVTNEQVLESLVHKHPIAQAILDQREASKLKSTYVDALPAAVFPGTGRVHTSFSQLVTATGRLASQDPNLQNIPIRTERGREIRRAFVPGGPEFVLLSADYSQIELRIMAHLSGDPALKAAFVHGEDIHTATAAKVYGVAAGDVTREMRGTAKMVNFGIIYGISAFGLSQRLGIPRTEAASIIDAYFAQYPGVKEYMDRTVSEARDRGYVETLTGRRRNLPDLRSSNGTIRAGAERNAINTPIQGTAADMIKIAMSRVHAALAEGGHRTRMLLQVHDELVFELHRDEEAVVVPLVARLMRDALPLSVPVEVETGTGANWLEAH
jgi:DNA polymerase-1